MAYNYLFITQVENKIITISFIFSAVAILFFSLFNALRAYGENYSQTENKKEISVDKKLRYIDQKEYVDNIEASKKTFFEKDIVEFQVRIENIGNVTLNNIKVKDNLPKYLGLIFYPGTFNSTQNTIEWTIDKLDPGQSKEYLIRAKIQNATKLSALTRQTNRAEANVDNLSDSDNASYFIGRTTVPATGASDIVLKTILVALTASSGFYFRKLARGY